MQAKLILKKGDFPEPVVTLSPGTSFVGRAAGNDIVLADPEISRRHAQFLVAEDSSTVVLEDLGSTNGTFLNGRRLTKATALSHKDTVAFGDSYSFTFEGVALEAIPSPDDEDTGPLPASPQTIAQPRSAFANELANSPAEQPAERSSVDEPSAPSPPPNPFAEATPDLFTEQASNPFAEEPPAPFVDEQAESYSPPPAAYQPPPQAAYPPPADAAYQYSDPPPAAPTEPAKKAWWQRWYVTCGCLPLLLMLLCVGTIFFLDAYQQGQLLYCGPLRPFWEIVLGPFGFAPLCL